MTCIVIGLGNFGAALAIQLTKMGHDVIGVDSDMHLVEEYKDAIGATICVNLVDKTSLNTLPLDDADEVVVAIGEQMADAFMVVALLKQHGVKHLVARAGNELHTEVLKTLGVDEILMPEADAANTVALSLETPEVQGAYIVTESHQLEEIDVPKILVAQTVAQANIEETFNVRLVAVKRRHEEVNIFKKNTFKYQVEPLSDELQFMSGDRLLIFGELKALQKLKKQLY